jgi:hypothetical protein
MYLGFSFMQPSDSTLGWPRRRRKLLGALGVSVLLLQFLAPSLHTIAEHSASGDLVAQGSAPKGVAESFGKSETGASSTAPAPGATTHDPSQCVICKNLAQLRGNIVVVVAAFIHAPLPQGVAIPNATEAVAPSGLDKSSSPRAPPTPNPIAS